MRTLPEHAALTTLDERLQELVTQRGQTQTEVDDLGREQRKADADVEQVKARRTRNAERIQAGLVNDPKQLQAMQHEMQTLDRRINDLEDAELEVMERLEDGQARLTALTAELVRLEAERATSAQGRDTASSEIVQRRANLSTERAALAADLPRDLLTLYDKLRAQMGGVAVGALHQRRCEGCRLDIGAADLARMTTAPSDEVLRCEECNRILVRTSESGL